MRLACAFAVTPLVACGVAYGGPIPSAATLHPGLSQLAAGDIPCASETPRVVAETDNDFSNMYGVIAVEGCGQRLTYMVRGDGLSAVLIGRISIGRASR